MIHPGRQVSVIRRAEDLDSLCAHDLLPAHLARPVAAAAGAGAGDGVGLPSNLVPLRRAG